MRHWIERRLAEIMANHKRMIYDSPEIRWDVVYHATPKRLMGRVWEDKNSAPVKPTLILEHWTWYRGREMEEMTSAIRDLGNRFEWLSSWTRRLQRKL